MVNYKLKYLKYKKKYLKLSGGVNIINIDDETQFEINDNTYELITEFEGCRLSLSIGYNQILSKLVSDEQIQLYQDDKDKKNINIDLFLHALYAGKSPKGYIREVLCKLLIFLVIQKIINEDSIICLEASGSIRDSAINLIKMYEDMGFRLYAFNAEKYTLQSKEPFSNVQGVEFIKDDNGMFITSEDSGWPNQIGKTRSQDIWSYGLMYTNIRNLLNYCARRFGINIPKSNSNCNIM